jgi:hypothetical protein
MYECETWSLTFREEHRLRVFENWVLRGIFGPERDEVTGSGENYIMRSLMICSPNSVWVITARRLSGAGRCARRGGRKCIYRVLVGKPDGKRPLGGPWRNWEDNLKMHRHEVRCGDMDWIEVAQDRDRWRAVVKGLMNIQAP